MFDGFTQRSGKRAALFVNPYTGEVLGSADQANQFSNKIHQFHTHLLIGEIADQVTGWSAVFLFVLSITGIILCWPRKLFRLRWNFSAAGGSAKRFHLELHNLLGILSLLVLLIFAWTPF